VIWWALIHKNHGGFYELVVGSVTTSESPLLYVFALFDAFTYQTFPSLLLTGQYVTHSFSFQYMHFFSNPDLLSLIGCWKQVAVDLFKVQNLTMRV